MSPCYRKNSMVRFYTFGSLLGYFTYLMLVASLCSKMFYNIDPRSHWAKREIARYLLPHPTCHNFISQNADVWRLLKVIPFCTHAFADIDFCFQYCKQHAASIGSGQSYKHFTIVIYDSRVVLTRKLTKVPL